MHISRYTKILCVDDEIDVLGLYQAVLGKGSFMFRTGFDRVETEAEQDSHPVDEYGYEVVLAQSGEEAVEKVLETAARGEFFVAGCFDLKLSGSMDGLETIKRIIEIDPNIHCVIVSGYSEGMLQQFREIFPSHDQWLFLNKPFGKDELLQVVHHLAITWYLKRVNEVCTEELEEEVRKKTQKYKEIADRLILINQFSREIATATDIVDSLNKLMEELRKIVNAKIGSLLLLEGEEKLVVMAAAGPDSEKVMGIANDIHQNRISNYTLQHKELLLINNLYADSRFVKSTEQARIDFDSIISAPLLAKDRAIGVLNFAANKAEKIFTQEEADLVYTMAGQVASAIENARLYRKLKESYDRISEAYLLTVKALTLAIDAKDHYTYGHSQRVAHYSLAIAREMNYSDVELARLERACYLHDVGKIGIPESILNKPEALTFEEFEVMKSHPDKGAEILKDIPFLNRVMGIIRHHHERFDGGGYSGGLSGDDIPLSSRIMAVADTFDAMTSDRPYRKGRTQTEAFDEVRRCSGSQFDPKVVDAFVKAFQKPGFSN